MYYLFLGFGVTRMYGQIDDISNWMFKKRSNLMETTSPVTYDLPPSQAQRAAGPPFYPQMKQIVRFF